MFSNDRPIEINHRQFATHPKTNSPRGCDPPVFKCSISANIRRSSPTFRRVKNDLNTRCFPIGRKKKKKKIAKKFRFVLARKKKIDFDRADLIDKCDRKRDGCYFVRHYCENGNIEVNRRSIFAEFEVRTTPFVVFSYFVRY